MPEWPCRQAQAVADTAFIKHKDVQIPTEGLMLQSIIRHHDIHFRMSLEKRLACSGAISADPGRHPSQARQQQGLITHIDGATGGADLLRRGACGVLAASVGCGMGRVCPSFAWRVGGHGLSCRPARRC